MKELCTGTLYRMRKTKGIKIAMGLTYIAAIFYFICGKMVADGSLPQEQALLLRRRVEGYKYEEIAEEFDIPVGTVKSALFTAKKRLKRLLEQ